MPCSAWKSQDSSRDTSQAWVLIKLVLSLRYPAASSSVSWQLPNSGQSLRPKLMGVYLFGDATALVGVPPAVVFREL